MKASSLTIRLDRDLERQLARLAGRSGRSRSEIVRDALRRQLAVLQFEDALNDRRHFFAAAGVSAPARSTAVTPREFWSRLSG